MGMSYSGRYQITAPTCKLLWLQGWSENQAQLELSLEIDYNSLVAFEVQSFQ